MYMRAFVVRFAFLGVLGVGIALSAAFRQPVAHEAAPQALPNQATPVASAPLPVVTLATVHVHADMSKAAAKPAAQARVDTTPAPASLTGAGSDHRSGGLAPTLRLDMPYYSFGRMLPRVGKE
ncbi:MAG TPA: hypothetical protein VLB69_09495 [Rudaea sp.]|nr:hypothetical protein [Rudaea sp.]